MAQQEGTKTSAQRKMHAFCNSGRLSECLMAQAKTRCDQQMVTPPLSCSWPAQMAQQSCEFYTQVKAQSLPGRSNFWHMLLFGTANRLCRPSSLQRPSSPGTTQRAGGALWPCPQDMEAAERTMSDVLSDAFDCPGMTA